MDGPHCLVLASHLVAEVLWMKHSQAMITAFPVDYTGTDVRGW